MGDVPSSFKILTMHISAHTPPTSSSFSDSPPWPSKCNFPWLKLLYIYYNNSHSHSLFQSLLVGTIVWLMARKLAQGPSFFFSLSLSYTQAHTHTQSVLGLKFLFTSLYLHACHVILFVELCIYILKPYTSANIISAARWGDKLWSVNWL